MLFHRPNVQQMFQTTCPRAQGTGSMFFCTTLYNKLMRLKLIKKYSTLAHLNTQGNFTRFPFRKLKGKENKNNVSLSNV